MATTIDADHYFAAISKSPPQAHIGRIGTAVPAGFTEIHLPGLIAIFDCLPVEDADAASILILGLAAQVLELKTDADAMAEAILGATGSHGMLQRLANGKQACRQQEAAAVLEVLRGTRRTYLTNHGSKGE